MDRAGQANKPTHNYKNTRTNSGWTGWKPANTTHTQSAHGRANASKFCLTLGRLKKRCILFIKIKTRETACFSREKECQKSGSDGVGGPRRRKKNQSKRLIFYSTDTDTLKNTCFAYGHGHVSVSVSGPSPYAREFLVWMWY